MLPKGLLKEYSRAITLLVVFFDMLMVFVAGWMAYLIRFHESHLSSLYMVPLIIAVLMTPPVFFFSNIYFPLRAEGIIKHFAKLAQSVAMLGLLLAGLSFFTKSGYVFSRTWFILWMTLTLVHFIAFRIGLLIFLRLMRTFGWNEKRVVILGAGELGVKFAGTVQQALWTGFRIVTFMDDHAALKPPSIQHIPVIQTPLQLSQYLTEQAIDEIWLALPLRAELRVKEILHELRHHTITTRFVLDIFGLDLLNHSLTEVAGFPVLNIRSTPMIGINRIIKAIEDRMLAAMILILISPVLLLIAVLIKCTSRGPILFKQHRLGWDGQVIKIYKFRTMIEHEEHGHVTQATVHDKRVTPFGRWLRRTSLDELPQFINVLQGRMSVVGPRPHALLHNDLYKEVINTYMQRHRVKPGITGWAQVNGWRGETDTLDKMQKRIDYDLYYINNWSLSFDLKIIFLTFIHGFFSRNAY